MTSIDENARTAQADDLDVIEALFEHAVDELEPRRGGAMWARREARPRPARKELGLSLTDEDQMLVVGTIDEVVVGYAALRSSPLHDGTRLAILEDIYVLPDARAVGVGEAMLNVCLEWSRRKGCVGLDSLALPGDRHTKNFFESFGLVARAIIVHRDLQADR